MIQFLKINMEYLTNNIPYIYAEAKKIYKQKQKS